MSSFASKTQTLCKLHAARKIQSRKQHRLYKTHTTIFAEKQHCNKRRQRTNQTPSNPYSLSYHHIANIILVQAIILLFRFCTWISHCYQKFCFQCKHSNRCTKLISQAINIDSHSFILDIPCSICNILFVAVYFMIIHLIQYTWHIIQHNLINMLLSCLVLGFTIWNSRYFAYIWHHCKTLLLMCYSMAVCGVFFCNYYLYQAIDAIFLIPRIMLCIFHNVFIFLVSISKYILKHCHLTIQPEQYGIHNIILKIYNCNEKTIFWYSDKSTLYDLHLFVESWLSDLEIHSFFNWFIQTYQKKLVG